MLECQKANFSLPSDCVYLNSAYMGPLPNATVAAGQQALAARAAPIGLTPDDFFSPAERTRRLCAQLVHAEPERVAFVPTAAAGLGIAARNLRPRAGQNVVVSADQFPSNVYPWRRWRAAGVSIRTVRPPAVDACDSEALCRRARTWNAMLLEAIDADTALVALEQAHWTDGTLFDLERIGERCRATGAAFVVDATQTAGAMTLDASAIRADALVVHAYKSMLSNYGLGFAVLGDRFAEGVPAEESWLTRRGSEDFSRLVDYQDDYAPGMRRYDTSLRANPVLIRMLEASCSLLLDWRPERIREYLLSIEREAVARLRAAGFGVADEDLRAANIFGIGLPPGLDPQACRAALAARRIHVAVRGACVRVSPHVCNDAADLDRLADALIDLARDLPRAHPAGR